MEYFQDYIMRMIHEMIRVILKFLFNLDTAACEQIIADNQEMTEKYNALTDMVNNKEINHAENLLSEQYTGKDTKNLLIGILFYDYLNTLEDDFLEKCNYSRQEIKEGLESLLKIYGKEELSTKLRDGIFPE